MLSTILCILLIAVAVSLDLFVITVASMEALETREGMKYWQDEAHDPKDAAIGEAALWFQMKTWLWAIAVCTFLLLVLGVLTFVSLGAAAGWAVVRNTISTAGTARR